MTRVMVGQTSLSNFLRSVQFQNPDLAAQLYPDCYAVSINALAADKTPGKAAAERLRRASDDLPEIQSRVLENALLDLGF